MYQVEDFLLVTSSMMYTHTRHGCAQAWVHPHHVHTCRYTEKHIIRMYISCKSENLNSVSELSWDLILFLHIWSSEFEELEAVPSLSFIEGPLEPPTSSATAPVPDVTDDSFVNIFSVCTFVNSCFSCYVLLFHILYFLFVNPLFCLYARAILLIYHRSFYCLKQSLISELVLLSFNLICYP